MTSPENIKTHAPWVTPPLRVIPVIYVPGILGRNLRDKKTKGLNLKLKGD